MKTQKQTRYSPQDGDVCKINAKGKYEDRLIEDHPQHLIEDHPQGLIENHHIEEEPIAAVGAPVAGGSSSRWWAWCLAGLVGLMLIAGAFFYANMNDNRTDGTAYTKTTTTTTRIALASAAAPGSSEDYIYYFSNDKSDVPANRKLDRVAEKAEQDGADVVITAYASTLGNEGYNQKLSEKRANNIANYLIAHGVPSNHIKIVPNGETTTYGDNAHNRRANIHLTYPS